MSKYLLGFLVVSFFLFSCGDDDKNTVSGGDSESDGSSDTFPSDTQTGSSTDDDTQDTDTSTGEPIDPAAQCNELGLPIADFIADLPDDHSLYAMAADLTVPTENGPWTLSENWSGCDTYLFIQDVPNQAAGWTDKIWDSEQDFRVLFRDMPKNVHLFFAPNTTNDDLITEALDVLKANVDSAISKIPDENDKLWWSARVHYINKSAKGLDGWLGEINRSPGWGAAIDRFQRIRYIGSYADSSRYDSAKGWFAPNISMVGNEARYYNFEAEREAALDPDATIVEVFDGSVMSGDCFADVTLPDAALMATFDTMEFDLYLGCEGDGEYGDCPEWDYLVNLFLCDEQDTDNCNTEIGRWITTYHREGRWVHDVSAMLPLLIQGGQRRFKFYTQNTYELKLDIRLSNQSKTEVPDETIPLYFNNDTFGLGYNDLFNEMTVTIPSDAKKVELATVITGHGMSQPGNCAEFCTTTQIFTINGTPNTVDHAEQVEGYLSCMAQVEEGTVPNQYGTWWYSRNGWCPGKEVPVEMLDITSQVTLGADATIDYEAYFEGQPYDGDNWRHIYLSSWLVISR